MDEKEQIPVKAIDWLLYNHVRVRQDFESISFIIKTVQLEGLGGTGRGARENDCMMASSRKFINERLIEDYEIIKETFSTVLNAVDAAVFNLHEQAKLIYRYKYVMEFTYSTIRRVMLEGRIRQKICTKTIERIVAEIREETNSYLVAYGVTDYDILKMMRRFGYLRKERTRIRKSS